MSGKNLSFLEHNCNCKNNLDFQHIETKYAEQLDSKVLENVKPASSLHGCLHCGTELANQIPFDNRNIIEVGCKGITSEFYALIPDDFKEELLLDDILVIKCADSHETAWIKSIGNIVKFKRQRLGLYGEELPVIIRKIKHEDETILAQNQQTEDHAKESFRQKAKKFNLEMKLINTHLQFDRNKFFFFYTADGRVDFRELAKDLAAEFKTRIELRQIGVRDEAKKIGGIGICGREYCCSTFMENFKKISTQLAVDQNLNSSASKLSGPCGKLKCCLSYEKCSTEEKNDSEETAT